MRHCRVFPFLALVLVLSSCTVITPEAAPSATPKATTTSTATPTPTPTPSPTPAPLVLSDCETLLPIQTVNPSGSRHEFFGEFPAAELSLVLSPPSQADVLASARASRACLWAVPNSDNSFRAAAAVIAAEQSEILRSELRAAGYWESTNGAATLFEMEDDDVSYLNAIGIVHVFSGAAWIIVETGRLEVSETYALAILDSLRTANPDLGL